MAKARHLLAIALVAAASLRGSAGRAERPSNASAGAAASPATKTFVFPYEQRRYLYSRNPAGGLAYVTAGAQSGASLPVVVFLHGMNPDELVHPWFGPPYGDLRPVLDGLVAARKVTPLVIAAPTHTRYATGATVMWPRFDLADLLDATQAALGDSAKIDRARVVVVGHSAAGCNPNGGLFAESIRRAKPLALVDIDGCVDDHVVTSLGDAAATTKVRFFWQRSWARPVRDLATTCPACSVEEITDFAQAPPHDAIVPRALERALSELLPP